MQPALSAPLTDAELDRLDDFLYFSNPGEAMSLEEIDGFFCALICGPELVPPSEPLPHVFGGELVQGRGFKTIEEAQELLNLLARHWNTIAATLVRDEPYPVLIGEYEDGRMAGFEWARGFEQGMYLRQDSWAHLAKDKEFGAALLPIIVLAEDDDHKLTSESVTLEAREAMLDVLAGSVLLIYRYFSGTVNPKRKTKQRARAKKA
jgi:uncharacterized protein